MCVFCEVHCCYIVELLYRLLGDVVVCIVAYSFSKKKIIILKMATLMVETC